MNKVVCPRRFVGAERLRPPPHGVSPLFVPRCCGRLRYPPPQALGAAGMLGLPRRGAELGRARC